ncbi:SIS domain-containing protein [Oligoflexus tunisiensis]|uniref:SIS domain-containing protein n=1 Tax=Oligoflexus tunisiensis TaxID=708132 RepID=UPI00159F0281|nr:SIS domain-containing protein [Oligoflexus tunisiensis]
MKHLMIEEALAAPRLIQQHIDQPHPQWQEFFQELRTRSVLQLVTIARGSSDHAAQYFSYAVARRMGLMPVSLSPSLLTLHEAALRWGHALTLAISQSGASPDLCHAMQKAKDGGALTLALINQADSPLSRVARHVLPMGAGEERSVAATKSFLLSLVNAVMMLGFWEDDQALWSTLKRLPDRLDHALQMTRDHNLDFVQASSLLVLSRGQGLPIAQEIALKFNEVCRLPALAYSAAEFRHGPMALVRAGDPVLVIGLRGPELPGLLDTVNFLKELGASVIFVAPEGTPHASMPYPVDGDALCDPIVAAQILYPLIARLALRRGYDPDQPAHLRKVTMTL